MSTRKRKKITAGDKLALSIMQQGRCAACGFPLDPRRIHVDHLIHFSRGGTNELRNLRLLCAPCNLQRGAKF